MLNLQTCCEIVSKNPASDKNSDAVSLADYTMNAIKRLSFWGSLEPPSIGEDAGQVGLHLVSGWESGPGRGRVGVTSALGRRGSADKVEDLFGRGRRFPRFCVSAEIFQGLRPNSAKLFLIERREGI